MNLPSPPPPTRRVGSTCPSCRPAYQTNLGSAYCGDALALLSELPSDSVDLVLTSPPFALLLKKEYGNRAQDEYVEWLLPFATQVRRVLKDTGSFVLDMGGAYQKGVPSRSLYQFRTLLALCDRAGFFLAQDFYWHNPSKLPSPAEWVTRRKIRAKDSVNTVWWLSKTEWPKADVKKVLVPYSESMKKLLKDPDYYKPTTRPSGHEISGNFHKDNGGAIPSNLLQIPNTESNSPYQSWCKALGIPSHPARFPAKLPEFFIRLLTDPDDLVVDIFAGSNTTGWVAEVESRRWLSFEDRLDYVAASAFRFLPKTVSRVNAADVYAEVLVGREVQL
jgi:site-specific DNA-methyltransferase (cytosine-N4-specific)